MNIKNYIISIIISFIIISLIILFFVSFKNVKIEPFAIDTTNIATIDDTTKVLSNLNDNLIIYLKFNNSDISNQLVTKYGRNQYNAKLVDSSYRFSNPDATSTNNNICSMNTTDYVKGNAAIQFNGSGGIIQTMNSIYISNQFTIAFFLKYANNTNGTIVAQALQNPTLGWLIRINNSTLEIVLGTNADNSWATIISVPNFVNLTSNEWYHIALTYNSTTSPKWNLYLDGTKRIISADDNTTNRQLHLLATQISAVNTGSTSITTQSFGIDKHFLTIGCQVTNNIRTRIDSSDLLDISYLNINISGTRNVNYEIAYIGNEHFYIKFLSGTTTLTMPAVNCSAEILIVGGGGGGGQNCGWEGGGGGGAGGLGYGTLTLTGNQTYTITVGGGGTGGHPGCNNGTNGGNSTISGHGINETAYGGGGGGWQPGLNGGSGGGGSGHGGNFDGGAATRGSGSLTYYGNKGGFAHWASRGGGGGGAGSRGSSTIKQWDIDGDSGGRGRGGDGLQFNMTGVNTWYAGGGGGSAFRDNYGTGAYGGYGGGGKGGNTNESGGHGAANTGSGGGGTCGWAWGGNRVYSGNGGSGVVILKFARSNFFNNNLVVYRNIEPSSITIGNFVPSGTLMDDLRLYNTSLSENDIKTIYYGTKIATMNTSAASSTTSTMNDSTDCIDSSLSSNANLIAIPSSSFGIENVSAITATANNTPNGSQNRSQYRQTFTVNNSNIELLFSQPLFSTTNPNPYSPIKLFNKDITTTLNSDINFCAFLSTYALDKVVNNNTYLYNYDTDGTYALSSFYVPNCGNIVFNNNGRPQGDYIYIKFVNSFVLKRYAFKSIQGFANRAPSRWTLYIYNIAGSQTIGLQSGNALTSGNYCVGNRNEYTIDINSNTIASNEYLFVFHNIVGNNPNDNFGMLAFQEMVLYRDNPNLTSS